MLIIRNLLLRVCSGTLLFPQNINMGKAFSNIERFYTRLRLDGVIKILNTHIVRRCRRYGLMTADTINMLLVIKAM